jgi:hypothetical protein
MATSRHSAEHYERRAALAGRGRGRRAFKRYANLGPEVTRDAVNPLDKLVNGNVAMARGGVVAASTDL